MSTNFPNLNGTSVWGTSINKNRFQGIDISGSLDISGGGLSIQNNPIGIYDSGSLRLQMTPYVISVPVKTGGGSYTLVDVSLDNLTYIKDISANIAQTLPVILSQVKFLSTNTTDTNINSNLEVSGNLIVKKTSLFTGDVSMNSNIGVLGNARIKGDAIIDGSMTITGSLYVAGTTTYINTSQLQVQDKLITLNQAATLQPTIGVGIEISGNNYGYIMTDSVDASTFLVKAPSASSQQGTMVLQNTSDNTVYITKLNASSDSSFNGNLFVSGPFTANSSIIGLSDASINGRILAQRDASFNSNIWVSNLLTANGRIIGLSDASINGRIMVQRDASFNSNIWVSNLLTANSRIIGLSDASINGRIMVQRDASFNANLWVSNTLTSNGIFTANNNIIGLSDTSLNGRLLVQKDGSFNANLWVSGNLTSNGAFTANSNIIGLSDTSLNGRLLVQGDGSFNANLWVSNSLTTNGVFTANSNIIGLSDTSLNGRLLVQGDGSFNSNLWVSSNLTSNGTFTANSNIIGLSDTSLNGRLLVQRDGSFNANLWVSGNLTANSRLTANNIIGLSDTSLNGRLLVQRDGSFNANLWVSGNLTSNGTFTANSNIIGLSDTSLNGRLLVQKDGSFNANLWVSGNLTSNGTFTANSNIIGLSDTSLNGRLLVQKDGSFNANLWVSNTLTANGVFTANSNIIGLSDTSLNGRLLVQKDGSFNANLWVSSNLTSNGTFTANSNIIGLSDTSLNGRLLVQRDGSFNSNLWVSGNLTSNGTFTANSNIIGLSDTSLNGRLLVQRDGSFNSNLWVSGNLTANSNVTVNNNIIGLSDTSLNGRLLVQKDGSFNANLWVSGNLTSNGAFTANSNIIGLSDTSLNGRLLVQKDGSFNANLWVSNTLTSNGTFTANNNIIGLSDTSLNGRILVQGDASFNANLWVSGNLTSNGTFTANSNIIGLSDTSLNGRLLVQRDASFNSNLWVSGNLTSNGTFTANSNIIGLSDTSLNGRLLVQRDGSFNSNLWVSGNLTANSRIIGLSDTSLNGRLLVQRDASFNANLFVSIDVSANGNLKSGGFIIQNLSGQNIQFGSNNFSGGTITTAARNTAIGLGVMTNSSLTGSQNVGVGQNAFYFLTSGTNNAAVGHSSLYNLTSGNNNTAFGVNSLLGIKTTTGNSAYGMFSGRDLSNGNYNVFMGYNSGQFFKSPGTNQSDNNIFIGSNSGIHTDNSANSYTYLTCIGANSGSDPVLNGNNRIILGSSSGLEDLYLAGNSSIYSRAGGIGIGKTGTSNYALDISGNKRQIGNRYEFYNNANNFGIVFDTSAGVDASWNPIVKSGDSIFYGRGQAVDSNKGLAITTWTTNKNGFRVDVSSTTVASFNNSIVTDFSGVHIIGNVDISGNLTVNGSSAGGGGGSSTEPVIQLYGNSSTVPMIIPVPSGNISISYALNTSFAADNNTFPSIATFSGVTGGFMVAMDRSGAKQFGCWPDASGIYCRYNSYDTTTPMTDSSGVLNRMFTSGYSDLNIKYSAISCTSNGNYLLFAYGSNGTNLQRYTNTIGKVNISSTLTGKSWLNDLSYTSINGQIFGNTSFDIGKHFIRNIVGSSDGQKILVGTNIGYCYTSNFALTAPGNFIYYDPSAQTINYTTGSAGDFSSNVFNVKITPDGSKIFMILKKKSGDQSYNLIYGSPSNIPTSLTANPTSMYCPITYDTSTWTDANGSGAYAKMAISDDGKYVYIGSQTGIYRSGNGGVDISYVDISKNSQSSNPINVIHCDSTGKYVVATTNFDSGSSNPIKGLFFSTNYGQSFKDMTVGGGSNRMTEVLISDLSAVSQKIYLLSGCRTTGTGAINSVRFSPLSLDLSSRYFNIGPSTQDGLYINLQSNDNFDKYIDPSANSNPVTQIYYGNTTVSGMILSDINTNLNMRWNNNYWYIRNNERAQLKTTGNTNVPTILGGSSVSIYPSEGTGSVGINTLVPSANYSLDISGNTNISGNLRANKTSFFGKDTINDPGIFSETAYGNTSLVVIPPVSFNTTTLTYGNLKGNSAIFFQGRGNGTDGFSMGLFGAGEENNPVPYLQSMWDADSGRPLYLNPLGGTVNIGNITADKYLNTYALDVSGDLRIGNPTNPLTITSSTTSLYNINSGADITITGSRVGINVTPASAYKLDVNGDTLIRAKLGIYSSNNPPFTGNRVLDISGSMRIYEPVGTDITASTGSLVFEHGDDNGVSSILFESKNSSDYAYIKYDENLPGTGYTGGNNGALVIGIEGNTTSTTDRICLMGAGGGVGPIGINTLIPGVNYSLDISGNLRVGNPSNQLTINSSSTLNTIGTGSTSGNITISAGSTSGNITISAGSTSGNITISAVNGNIRLNNKVGIAKDPTSTYALDINGTVNATSYNATSDYRIKTNVIPLEDTHASVDTLRPVSYFNTLANSQDYGFIAHEVAEYYPFLVSGQRDVSGCYQSLNYTGIIPILVKDLKQTRQELSETRQELNMLRERLDTIINSLNL